ncbi:hypothetical protein [Novipirellula rosea]|uniref:Uncharacterized protein n=1 Tax=Novipirellula rosea TaxID=1031540 RepID=A0ABP8MAC7_9BACT
MNDFHKSLLAGHWATQCAIAREEESRAAQLCVGEYLDLIRCRTAEFCDQPIPDSDVELGKRLIQSVELTCFVVTIRNASRTASRHPRVAHEIFAAAKEFADTATLDSNHSLKSLQLRKTISKLVRFEHGLTFDADQRRN